MDDPCDRPFVCALVLGLGRHRRRRRRRRRRLSRRRPTRSSAVDEHEQRHPDNAQGQADLSDGDGISEVQRGRDQRQRPKRHPARQRPLRHGLGLRRLHHHLQLDRNRPQLHKRPRPHHQTRQLPLRQPHRLDQPRRHRRRHRQRHLQLRPRRHLLARNLARRPRIRRQRTPTDHHQQRHTPTTRHPTANPTHQPHRHRHHHHRQPQLDRRHRQHRRHRLQPLPRRHEGRHDHFDLVRLLGTHVRHRLHTRRRGLRRRGQHLDSLDAPAVDDRLSRHAGAERAGEPEADRQHALERHIRLGRLDRQRRRHRLRHLPRRDSNGTTTATTTTISGLACGTSYTVGVDAADAAANRSARTTLTAATASCPADTQAPTAPTNLAVSNPTGSSIDLSWSASTDDTAVAGYTLYRDGDEVGTATTTSFSFGGLVCGTAYSLGVEASDAAGNRSFRSGITASTMACPDTQAPSVPTNLRQTGSTTSSVTVAWDASTDNVGVAGYGTYLAARPQGTTTATTTTISGLVCGTSYTVVRRCSRRGGNRSAKATSPRRLRHAL